MATIVGANKGSGNDTDVGTNAADLILGNAGNDIIVGNGGLDSLYGGIGADTISFGSPSSNNVSGALVYGGLGNDFIFNDTVTGSFSNNGNNTIYGGTGNATSDSMDGSNIITLAGDIGSDLVFAGGGGDSITTGTGLANTVIGGVGNDTIAVNASFSTINGDMGADLITAANTSQGDTIHGGQGNDTLVSTSNSGNILAADLGNDLILDSGGGRDSLYGGKGNDSINISGGGADLVFAGLDSDTITVTGTGNDSIYGGTDTTGQAADSANFILAGTSTGRDLFVGGGGNDSIVASTQPIVTGGATPVDTLTGGLGNDTFSFGAATGTQGYNNATATTAGTVDSVTDFVSGTDKFQLAGDPTVANNAALSAVQTNTTTQSLSQAATAVLAGDEAVATKSFADIFTYGGSNYLVVDTDGGKAYNAGDYLINVNTVTNLKTTDFI